MIRFFFPESLIVEYIFYQIISDLLCFISLILKINRYIFFNPKLNMVTKLVTRF